MNFSNNDKLEYIFSHIKQVIDKIWDKNPELYCKLENTSIVLGENKTISGVYNGLKRLELSKGEI